MQFLLKKITLPILLFCGFFTLYITELSRSVYGGDVGDLVTAAAVGGVAHPSGYPLFTFLGFLLTKTFLSAISPAFAVGFISSTSAAIGVVAFYFLTKQLTKKSLPSLIASLVLGFSFLYWFYAETAEVFALNALFAIVIFLFAILYRNTKKISYLFVLLFLMGLSATHHETIIFVFPSILLLVGKQAFISFRRRPMWLFWSAVSLILGLTPFLYIPIAASHQPLINWDRVHDFNSFLRLILRKDYGTLQAGLFDAPSFSQRLVILRVYLEYILFQLTLPVVLLVMVGFWKIFTKDKLIFFAILLAWILSGPFFLTYAGFPLTSGFIIGAYERFILLSSVIFIIPFGIGLLTFSQFLARFLPKRHYDTFFQYVFLIIPLMLFMYNFPKTNLASVNTGDTYAKDFLVPLPRDAVFIVSGDTQTFNTWYMHFVLHVRPDVLVYNMGAAPLIHNIIADNIKDVPQKNSTEAIVTVVEQLSRTRPVFSTNQFQSKKGEKITWVPYGLLYKMYLSTDTLPDKKSYEQEVKTAWSQLHPPTKKDLANPVNHSLTIAEIPNNYSNALIAAGTFIFSQYKDIDAALRLYQQALSLLPTNEKAYEALGVLYMGMPGKCNEAVANFSAALSIDSYQELPYFLLYREYESCFKDKKKADAVAKTYTSVFSKNFQEALKNSESSLHVATAQ